MGLLDLDQVNAMLEGASPQAILRWAVDTFLERVAATSSFQTQSVPLLHLIAQHVPQLPVLFIDTGYHFGETLAFRDSLAHGLGLNLVHVRPDPAIERQTRERQLYRSDPDLCCFHRKVAPLERALKDYDALISGVRAEQTSHRAKLRVVEREASGKLRIHPVIHWTKKDLWAYVDQHQLPPHPLFEDGYLSVGCQPCTRPVFEGEDERAGRWAGAQKTECGLHTQIDLTAAKADSNEEE